METLNPEKFGMDDYGDVPELIREGEDTAKSLIDDVAPFIADL